MLRNTESFIGYKILATDGAVGQVVGFYFESHTWHVRYLAVDTGSWLSERKVLLSTAIASRANLEDRTVPVDLKQSQVENSPDIDTVQPISRQQEEMLLDHYGWPVYWTQGIHFLTEAGVEVSSDTLEEAAALEQSKQNQPHVRSVEEVTGYRVQTSDGEVGNVVDFIVDDDIWIIESLVIDPGNWFARKRVLVPAQTVETISWAEAKVYINLPASAVENNPEFDLTAPVNAVSELQYYDYQGHRRK